jgi:hypothetical protein
MFVFLASEPACKAGPILDRTLQLAIQGQSLKGKPRRRPYPFSSLRNSTNTLTHFLGNNNDNSASELSWPSDRRLSAKLVPTFAWSARRRPYSRLPRLEPLLSLPSSSSVVLMRLSGPRSRPTTIGKSGSAGNRSRTFGSVARNSDH